MPAGPPRVGSGRARSAASVGRSRVFECVDLSPGQRSHRALPQLLRFPSRLSPESSLKPLTRQRAAPRGSSAAPNSMGRTSLRSSRPKDIPEQKLSNELNRNARQILRFDRGMGGLSLPFQIGLLANSLPLTKDTLPHSLFWQPQTPIFRSTPPL